MTGHAGTTHPLIRLRPLPLFDGVCWCPLCLSQVWSVKRKALPPRASYKGRRKPAEAGSSPPLKAAVKRHRDKAMAKLQRVFDDVRGCNP